MVIVPWAEANAKGSISQVILVRSNRSVNRRPRESLSERCVSQLEGMVQKRAILLVVSISGVDHKTNFKKKMRMISKERSKSRQRAANS